MPIIYEAVRRHIVVGVIAVVGGFLGSSLHDLTTNSSNLMRAERFEVVDRSGHLLSYWGPDPDRNIPAATPKGTLLVFLDQHGIRRFQLGASTGDHSPHLLFYDTDGPPDAPQRSVEPRLRVGLGWTGSPVLNMRGAYGDQLALGAVYGDVYGERELGWGLSFAAREVPATAWIGYSRALDGYRSGISLTNGTGKRWTVSAGDDPKPLPLFKQPR